MSKLKMKFLSPAVALLICTNIYADNLTYSIEQQSLKDAIEIISKKAKIPYIVKGNLLEGKNSNKIKNISGSKNALKGLLKGTNLEAVIEDGAILIRKKPGLKSSKESSNLGKVDIIEHSNNITEGSSSYTIDSMNTATKLNLSIKDTPQSIVVVTNQEMKDKGIQDFRDLTDSVAGFHSPVWDSDRLFISARGFSVDYYQIDGIATSYEGFHTEQNLALYDRVEIVKGASGLSTGAGNPAASINMVRKHANSKEFKGELTLTAGSWATYSGTVDLSIPLNEDGSIRSRIVAEKEDKESFRDFYEKETDTIYGIIDADLSDQTKVSLGASFIESKTKGSTWSGVPVFFSDDTLTNFSPSDSFTANWTSYDKKTTSAFTSFEHIFSNDIKINASYLFNKVESNPKTAAFIGYPDKTTGLGLSSAWGVWNSQYEVTSHALDLYTSIPFELGSQNHEFILGAMYSKEDTVSYGSEESTKNLIAQSIYSWDGNIIEPTYADAVLSYDEGTAQTGFYAVGKFDLRDDLKLIAGARLSSYEYKCTYDSWGCSDPYENKNVLTPYAGLVYDIDDNHSAYASYTNIFKTQNYKDINGEILDPKEGNNYEIGIKGEYFNKRLNAGITYFKIEQDNVAEKTGQIIPGTTNDAYKLVDGVTSKGFEVTVKGDITDKWNIDFGLSSFSLKDSEGNKTSTMTPRKEVSLSTKYKFGKLSVGGGVSWQDDIYTNVTNATGDSVKITQKDFYLVNAMAKYEFTKDLSLQLNIDNLFDKEYHSNVVYGWYGGGYIFGDPRKTTLTLNYKF